MLLSIVLVCVLFSEVHSVSSIVEQKPCSFPLPLDLPNRNDRSDQCWLRVEDLELTETISIWCYVAHSFLRNYIYEYNTQKMTDDNVDVSVWNEDLRAQDDIIVRTPRTKEKGLKDWRLTTVLDPVTHMRLYVTKKADCRLIMYSRDGMTNYKVDCEKILFHINDNLTDKSNVSRADVSLISACIFVIFASIKMLV